MTGNQPQSAISTALDVVVTIIIMTLTNPHQKTSLPSKKYVAGIVDVDPSLTKEENRENPYAFWENDTTDEQARNFVNQTYTNYGINFVEHRIGKGYHWFGEKIPRAKWKEWHQDLVRQVGNKEFPALTLRISRKYPDEPFERPLYHQVNSPPSNNHRALMHYLVKELKRENSTDLHQSMKHCGLDKYYKCVVYPICSICLKSGFGNVDDHIMKVHGVGENNV